MSNETRLARASTLNNRILKCVKAVVIALLVFTTGHARTQPVDKAQVSASIASRELSAAVLSSTREQRDAWRLKMAHSARKKGSCYTAEYPDPTWHEVPCKAAPHHLFGPPRRGTTSDTVGDGQNDFVAQPMSPLTLADGSFDAVIAASIETTGAGAGGINGSNMFTLQLNSEYFTTSVCTAALGPKCRGWVQFVYDNSVQDAFVQYWLLNYDFTAFTAACPTSWEPADGYCVRTAVTSTKTFPATATAADIQEMSVTGSGAGVTVYWAGSMISAPDTGIIPDLASHWADAEFNIFGDGGGGAATFGGNSSLTVRTQVETNTLLAPDCVVASYTGETNNLTLTGTPVIEPKSLYPAIIFNESNTTPLTPQSCAKSMGDPHITTFDGLYYNFYASGEFVLADAGPDFIVQARQESGAKVFKNPHVTMNTAVAIQIGTSRIAIYDSPARVVLNGKAITLANNKIMALPGDVSLYRIGNLYIVTRASGELVRAELNTGWMDLTVGLGRQSRASAKGILASPSRTALSMRDGTRLNEPVSASDLYERYAKSWLVQPKESLFLEHPVQFAAPTKLFTVADLEPKAATKARAACTAAGVTEETLLDSCIVDAAVLKSPIAVKAFSRALAPKVTIHPVEASRVNP